MRFLAPGWLLVGAITAATVVALHLLNRRRLRPLVFPTARFVPEARVRAVSPTLIPTDIALMLVRVAIVALIAVAMARPAGSPPRHTAVIVLVDRSPAADSVAIDVELGRLEQRIDTVIPMHGLSSGLLSARRAGRGLTGTADSALLIILSPVTAGLWDAATTELRASWPGAIRVVPTERRVDRQPGVRLVWDSAPVTDTAHGVYAAGAAMVGRFARTARARGTAQGRPVAWFADGSPAVMEYATASGCERIMGFREPDGDAMIRAAGLRFAERLAAPCGHGWTPDKYLPAEESLRLQLAGSGGAAAIERLGDPEQPIPVWPLLLAFAAMAGERIVRRRIT